MATPFLREPSCSRATLYRAGRLPTITECAAGTATSRGAILQCGISCPAAFCRTGGPLFSRLARGHLGDLDLDPQLDLPQHGIQLRVAGTQLEMGGGRL